MRIHLTNSRERLRVAQEATRGGRPRRCPAAELRDLTDLPVAF